MRDQTNPRTIDDAVEWLARMVQRGVYSTNTGRLLKVAAETVRALLAPEEPRTLDYILQNRKQLYCRLLNRSNSLSAASASSYVSRAERLVRDYQRWSEDPTGLQPKIARTRASKSMGVSQQERLREKQSQVFSASGGPEYEDAANFPPSWNQTGTTNYREHLLALATGKAYIKLPEVITPADLKLIMAVISTHCSSAESVVPEAVEGGAEVGTH